MPYHPISLNFKSEHTFTNDIVPFQRLEPSEIDAVLNRPFETPQTLEEALADINPIGIWLLQPKWKLSWKLKKTMNQLMTLDKMFKFKQIALMAINFTTFI